MKNPFKFGSIVDDPYFTNRTVEMQKVRSMISSDNHLILISPRRYGKSSLIFKVVERLNRPVIALDLQLITSTSDLAAQLLKRIYRVFPFERVRQYVRHFRIIPSITVNPVTNAVDVSFNPESSHLSMIEDVLNLIEQLSKKNKKLIVIFDELQEAKRIDPTLLGQLRSIMQHHQKVNYIFLGSQESLIREIFEKKKSPFYHFGLIIPLGKIPYTDFETYLNDRFTQITNEATQIVREILEITKCHPYYTQQLAFVVWEQLNMNSLVSTALDRAVSELIHTHDIDYERIWTNFNRTDKKLLIGLSISGLSPLSEKFIRRFDIGASSTAFSSLKRLMNSGYITKNENKHEIDDPFFSLWINQRRDA